MFIPSNRSGTCRSIEYGVFPKPLCPNCAIAKEQQMHSTARNVMELQSIGWANDEKLVGEVTTSALIIDMVLFVSAGIQTGFTIASICFFCHRTSNFVFICTASFFFFFFFDSIRIKSTNHKNGAILSYKHETIWKQTAEAAAAAVSQSHFSISKHEFRER